MRHWTSKMGKNEANLPENEAKNEALFKIG
jgi:hypothetical protein